MNPFIQADLKWNKGFPASDSVFYLPRSVNLFSSFMADSSSSSSLLSILVSAKKWLFNHSAYSASLITCGGRGGKNTEIKASALLSAWATQPLRFCFAERFGTFLPLSLLLSYTLNFWAAQNPKWNSAEMSKWHFAFKPHSTVNCTWSESEATKLAQVHWGL